MPASITHTALMSPNAWDTVGCSSRTCAAMLVAAVWAITSVGNPVFGMATGRVVIVVAFSRKPGTTSSLFR